MIATRRRRMHFPVKRYVNMLIFGIVVYELYSVPATHKIIFDGPLKPFWAQVGGLEKKFVEPIAGPVIAPLVRPLNFAVQQKALADKAHEVDQLKTAAAAAQSTEQASEKKIADLQKQLAAKGGQSTATANAAGTPALAAGGLSLTTPAAPVTPSPDDIKNAAYWASMEPENAAQIAQHLAPADTARVFLAMKPDQVAEIMNVLPTAYNVKLKAVRFDGTLSP